MTKPLEKRESYIQARDSYAREILIKNRSKSSWRFVTKLLLLNGLIGVVALVFSSFVNSTVVLFVLMFFVIHALCEHEHQFFFLEKAAINFTPEGFHSDFGLITSQVFETGVDSQEYWTCFKTFEKDRRYRAKVKIYRHSVDCLEYEYQIKNPNHDVVCSEKKRIELDSRVGAEQVRNIIKRSVDFEFGWYEKKERKDKDD